MTAIIKEKNGIWRAVIRSWKQSRKLWSEPIGPATGFCKCDNKPAVCLKDGQFLEQLSDCYHWVGRCSRLQTGTPDVLRHLHIIDWPLPPSLLSAFPRIDLKPFTYSFASFLPCLETCLFIIFLSVCPHLSCSQISGGGFDGSRIIISCTPQVSLSKASCAKQRLYCPGFQCRY